MPIPEIFLRHNVEVFPSSDQEKSKGSTDARARLLDLVTSDFEFVRGSPLPLGATVVRGGVNFSLFAKNTAAVLS